jgi:predicted alpha/beta superfamily hydrolase
MSSRVEARGTVSIPRSQRFAFHSESVGDVFEIAVVPPPALVTGPVPVVVAGDLNNSFGMISDIAASLLAGASMPPVLLVGVGYPIGDDYAEFFRLRSRDYSPTADEAQQVRHAAMVGSSGFETGGGPAYLSFLTDELRPWLSETFETTDDTTFVGISMGGLFATYTLLTRPEAFQRYVISSPWLYWNEPVTSTYVDEYARTHSDLPARVFIGAGAAEAQPKPGMVGPLPGLLQEADVPGRARNLVAQLEKQAFPSLRLESRIYEDEDHFSSAPSTIAAGLRSVFEA